MNAQKGPVGVFDSGYGGLTILEDVRKQLPHLDYLYLGDNARAPYGNRSFDMVYEFTRQAVFYLYEQGCPLVILACNTASAKALRTIQQIDLPTLDPNFRVLGILRPTVEVVGSLTKTGHVGLVGTPGTIVSGSYPIEIHKLHPDILLTAEACPMWVPLVENNEFDKPGADYFIKQHIDNLLKKDDLIDTIILGCTHFPLLMPKILKYTAPGIRIVSQGEYVADSLKAYLVRHTDLDDRLTKGGRVAYYTTESADRFKETASIFLHEQVNVEHIELGDRTQTPTQHNH
jgi:glutamate racemase